MKEKEIVEVNAVKVSETDYSTVRLTEDDKVGEQYAKDNIRPFRRIGVASICTDPTGGDPKRLFSISVNSQNKWMAQELDSEKDQ